VEAPGSNPPTTAAPARTLPAILGSATRSPPPLSAPVGPRSPLSGISWATARRFGPRTLGWTMPN